ncbi:MAG: bifunctional hydroxymethylpyrimidine kinase/phosphomethylpyrimidine kinase [Nocardioidaceae bacterium]
MIPRVLTVAGTDPSGGAGTSADLKTFSALGAFGTSVVTAVVSQSTRGVSAVHQLSGEVVREQLDTLLDDVQVDAVKIGMLGTAEVVEAVADVLTQRSLPYVVLDPVMVATSGDRLLAPEAVSSLRERLLPLCDLVTPNLPEAADLLGTPQAADVDGMRAQLADLAQLCGGVLLKGGHLGGALSPDLLRVDGRTTLLSARRVPTGNSHGTGCTLSAAVAALRPGSPDWLGAVRQAKAYLSGALQSADRLQVGTGRGPVHHFHAWW